MKNCGHRFHVLVANRDFIDSVLVKVISPKNSPPTIVQDKVLALIQVGWWPWASPTATVKAPGPCLPAPRCRSPEGTLTVQDRGVLTMTSAQRPPHGRGLRGILNTESEARAGDSSVKDWVCRSE